MKFNKTRVNMTDIEKVYINKKIDNIKKNNRKFIIVDYKKEK